MASKGWESLVSIPRRSREEFANNRFALLFIDLDYITLGHAIEFLPIPPIQWHMHLCKLTCACCIVHAKGGDVVFDPL